MPSVGTRRSTRVFVSKTVAAAKPHLAAAAADTAHVLRSGKPFAPSKPLDKRASSEQNEWLGDFDDGGAAGGRGLEKEAEAGRREAVERPPEKETGNAPSDGKSFEVVYSQSRRQSQPDDSASDRMFGIVFTRNKQRKKPEITPFVERGSCPRFKRVEPVSVKPHGSCPIDFDRLRAALNERSSPLAAYHRHKKSDKTIPVEQVNLLKAALAEIKQNIDTTQCSANILVIDTDQCSRQEGAEVTLDSTDPKDWHIAVKLQGLLRYIHKPQEMKFGAVNSYTGAYMWTGDQSWKLEFTDQWEWLIFTEIVTECCGRNMRVIRNVRNVPVTAIPVPGVQEVSGYDDNIAASFVRPDTYIHVVDDEVERALMSNVANYDMNSGDERWLHHLNANKSNSSQISQENFEKIIFFIEKIAYNHSVEVTDVERVVDLCKNFGKRDMVAAVYDYWLKKRKIKHAGSQPLVKVFQGRSQLVTKLPRKTRSQRQRRGKTPYALQAAAYEMAKHQVGEAESKVRSAMEHAIRLRNRAQMYMENADLAVYKSVMALRLAEARWVSVSPEVASSILE